jgi:hypothetical protein
MSKTDELRAMREAKYARAAALRGATPQAKPQAAPRTKPEAEASPAPVEADTGLCGHRSMNGRTCTREAGHAAKSHRYS